MGARRRTKRSRNALTPKEAYERQVAKLRYRGRWLQIRPERREYIPRGRIQRVGMTPEEELKSHAPLYASEPEKMVYGWLSTHGIPFSFQVDFFGGRDLAGGAIVDFQIYDRNPDILLRLMGYYHQDPNQAELDDIQRTLLEEMGYEVLDVWEWEVSSIDALNETMDDIFLHRHRPNI